MLFNFRTNIKGISWKSMVISLMFTVGLSVVFYCLLALVFMGNPGVQESAPLFTAIFAFIFATCSVILMCFFKEIDSREFLMKESMRKEFEKSSALNNINELDELAKKEMELSKNTTMQKSIT